MFKISGDKFYALLTGQDDAFVKLHQALPSAISDYLQTINDSIESDGNSAASEIKESTKKSGRTTFDQITFENFSYYFEFDKL